MSVRAVNLPGLPTRGLCFPRQAMGFVLEADPFELCDLASCSLVGRFDVRFPTTGKAAVARSAIASCGI